MPVTGDHRDDHSTGVKVKKIRERKKRRLDLTIDLTIEIVTA